MFGSVLAVFLLVMTSGYFGGATTNFSNGNKKACYTLSSIEQNDAEIPTWSIGDKWTYTLDVRGEQNEYFDLDFDLTMDNLEFEVIEIQDELYILSMTIPRGDFSGSVSIDLGVFTFSGSIENAILNAEIFVNKSTLGIFKCQGTLSGETNKILLPNFDIDFQLEFEREVNNEGIKTNLSTLQFPININNNWSVPLTYLNITIDANQPNLGQNRLFSFVNGHEVECIMWDIIPLGTKEYDALKMTGVNYGDQSNIWYSPAIGNIMKLDFKNVELGFGYILKKLSIDLLSTTYQFPSNPPFQPSTPNGSTLFLAGQTGSFTTSTTDPDGDMIRYVFDWGDNSEKTVSDFVPSGETVEINHTWTKKGTFEIRVRARDKYGTVCSWSNPLSVTVENTRPTKPSTPDGPANGKIKNSYTYSTSAEDPDGHDIRYGFDWDGDDQIDSWTVYVNSGETGSKSYTWTSKGTYDIKVKAQDEYGEESEWSNPLTVSMPRNKGIHSLFQQLFVTLMQKYPRFFSVLENVFEIG